MINELPNIITSRSKRKQQFDGQPFGTLYRHSSGGAIIDDFLAAVSPASPESPYSFDREWDGYKRKSSLQCFNREKNVMVGHDFTPTELDLDRYVKELSLPLMKNPNQICTQFPITPNELQQFDFDNTVKSPFDEFNTHFGMNYGSYIGSDYARSVFSAAASQGRNNRTRCRNNSYDSDTTIASNQSFPTRHSIVDNSNDDTPRAQNLKFSTDLYTPKWVRYTGTKKEGLCEMCEPGKWFQLKNSAYWLA